LPIEYQDITWTDMVHINGLHLVHYEVSTVDISFIQNYNGGKEQHSRSFYCKLILYSLLTKKGNIKYITRVSDNTPWYFCTILNTKATAKKL